jgi:hypothetical protein
MAGLGKVEPGWDDPYRAAMQHPAVEDYRLGAFTFQAFSGIAVCRPSSAFNLPPMTD